VDCDLKKHWDITNEEVLVHSVYNLYNKIVAHCTFLSRDRPIFGFYRYIGQNGRFYRP